jgi:putative peptidoglycan lipid II flippase
VLGAVVGEVLLRRRFGRLDTARVLRAGGGFLLLATLGALAAAAVQLLVSRWLGLGPVAAAVAVVAGSLVALAVMAAATLVWRSSELDDVLRGLRGQSSGGRAGRHRAGPR